MMYKLLIPPRGTEIYYHILMILMEMFYTKNI
ncbi:hypothetical protein SAMN05444274_10633 [Mariniphaga anaerophila]|uniref:Uncharacterized protein n=1 Tax=Mariniphaga anaerophila TaxID=1484053 RepID=A0A1M5CAV7_9BACT|nr:hypothetical protein SAMN05444274_10633 [Mariniphaga anaerophila]